MAYRPGLLTNGALLLFASCSSSSTAHVPTGTAAELGREAENAASPQPFELSEAESWTLADAGVDPFAAYADGRVRCTRADFRPEATWLEVTTTQCNYATFAYQFSAAAPLGSRIRGQVAWSTLAAIDPAIGTLAFADDTGGVLWSHDVPIPSTSSLVDIDFELAVPAEPGSSLFFHVRNHGYNSWQLSPLTLAPP